MFAGIEMIDGPRVGEAPSGQEKTGRYGGRSVRHDQK